MTAKRVLDTNILLYAYDLDAGAKRDAAMEILSAAFAQPRHHAVSVQVLQEFHVNFVKAGHARAEAAALVADFAVFQVVDNNLALFRNGLAEMARWQLSLWDAMILVAPASPARVNPVRKLSATGRTTMACGPLIRSGE